MALGGFAGAVSSGRFEVRTDMGPAFADIVTGGHWMWPILLWEAYSSALGLGSPEAAALATD